MSSTADFVAAVCSLVGHSHLRTSCSKHYGNHVAQYWRLLPTNEPLWISVETSDDETTATVCCESTVHSSPESAATALLSECVRRLESASRTMPGGHVSCETLPIFDAWWREHGRRAATPRWEEDFKEFARTAWEAGVLDASDGRILG